MSVSDLFAAVPAGWTVTSLGDACEGTGGDIQTGPFGSQLHASDYVVDGIPVIMPQDIGENRVVVRAIARVAAEDAERLDRYRVHAGDIVCSRRGDVARRSLVRTEQDGWLCGTGCLRVRFGDGPIDSRFVSYYLAHPAVRSWLRRHAIGATLPNLNTALLYALPLVLPPLREQHAISSVLGALDDKIELNRHMNETLDALARAVFEGELAVAEADSAAKTHLGDHLEVVRGLGYTGAGLRSGLPLHNLDSIREGGGYKPEGIKYYSGPYRDRHTVRPGDVIVANTEQAHNNTLIGYPAIVPSRFGEVGLFSQDLYRVRPKEASPLTRSFVYLLLRSEPLRSIVAGYRNGTTVNHLPAEALVRPSFPLPPVDRIRALDERVSSLLAKIEANEDENEALAALRDALLPQLVSGEIRLGRGAHSEVAPAAP